MRRLLLVLVFLLAALPANAGLTFVQVQNNFAAGPQTTIVVNITTTAGSMLIVAGAQGTDNTSTETVSDSAGNTYTQTASGYTSSGAANRGAMWVKANALAVTSVTITFNVSQANPMVFVLEFTRGVTASAEDTSVNSNTAAGTSLTSGTYTTTNANDVLVYFMRSGAGQASWTPGAGFTIPNNNLTTGASGSNTRAAIQYQIVSATQAAQTTSMSCTASSSLISVFGAFKAAPLPITLGGKTVLGGKVVL